MDIAGLSTAMATMELQTEIGIAMLDKTLDLGETLSEGMAEMIDAAAMERSVTPSVGANVDIRI